MSAPNLENGPPGQADELAEPVFLTTEEVAASLGITAIRVAQLARAGRFQGAIKRRNSRGKLGWAIPAPAEITGRDDLPAGYIRVVEWARRNGTSKQYAMRLIHLGFLPEAIQAPSPLNREMWCIPADTPKPQRRRQPRTSDER